PRAGLPGRAPAAGSAPQLDRGHVPVELRRGDRDRGRRPVPPRVPLPRRHAHRRIEHLHHRARRAGPLPRAADLRVPGGRRHRARHVTPVRPDVRRRGRAGGGGEGGGPRRGARAVEHDPGGVRVVKALVVGAGAVGQVYGRALRRGGAEVAYLVKPKHAEAARRGFTIHPLPGAAGHFTDFSVLTEPAGAWDAVILTVPTPPLRQPRWLERLQAGVDTAPA